MSPGPTADPPHSRPPPRLWGEEGAEGGCRSGGAGPRRADSRGRWLGCYCSAGGRPPRDRPKSLGPGLGGGGQPRGATRPAQSTGQEGYSLLLGLIDAAPEVGDL